MFSAPERFKPHPCCLKVTTGSCPGQSGNKTGVPFCRAVAFLSLTAANNLKTSAALLMDFSTPHFDPALCNTQMFFRLSASAHLGGPHGGVALAGQSEVCLREGTGCYAWVPSGAWSRVCCRVLARVEREPVELVNLGTFCVRGLLGCLAEVCWCFCELPARLPDYCALRPFVFGATG